MSGEENQLIIKNARKKKGFFRFRESYESLGGLELSSKGGGIAVMGGRLHTEVKRRSKTKLTEGVSSSEGVLDERSHERRNIGEGRAEIANRFRTF